MSLAHSAAEQRRSRNVWPRWGKGRARRSGRLRPGTHGAERDGFAVFLRAETTRGLLLVGTTVAALIWANAAPGAYHAAWSAPAGLGPPWLHLDHLRVTDWVADGLLAVFFFVVGLELKQELTIGGLADRRSAALPAAAAAGGMITPALICLALTHSTPGAGRAWAIPVATDIAFALGAFALGVLSPAGPRVPAGLRTVLLGLAVADDLGGILLIAIGFSDGITPGWLAATALLLAAVALAHRQRWNSPLLHVPLAAATWVSMHAAGIHATVAGVALGLLVPVRPRPGEREPPATRLERHLSPISAAVIVPVFALSATGVSLAPLPCSTSPPTRSAGGWPSGWSPASSSASPPAPGSPCTSAPPACPTASAGAT